MFLLNNVIFVYLDLKNKSEVKIKLTDELINEYKEKLLTVTKKIKEDEFIKNKTDCKCEYNIICY